jgi:uncharacterized repeat protein (TIGR01451 family)
MKKLFSLLIAVCIGINAFASGHVATATGTDPSCYGASDGSAAAMASGGVGPYGFTWTGPSGYTGAGATISGLSAGTYIVTAIDSSDMSTAMYTLTITQPAAVVVTVNSPTICAGLTANLTASGASGYAWSPGATSTGVSTANATPPVTTSYTVTGTTAGCSATAVSTVTVQPVPVLTVNSPGICAGQTATLTVSGAFTYSWGGGATSTGASTATASPVVTTSYTVTGTTGGCSNTAVSTVTVNTPSISLGSFNAHCGMCDGHINNTTTGGLSYAWTGPSGYTSSAASPSGLCPGTYTVTANGTGGCTATATATVTNVPAPAVTINAVGATCGASNGTLTATASGGTPPYTYMWAPAGITSPTASGLAAGTYSITVTDANGCSITASGTVVNIPGPTALGATIVNAGCGTANGSVTIGAATGGTAPYTYSFNGGPFTATTFYNALAPGAYPLTVRDANGCTFTRTVVISNSGGPASCAVTTVNSICAGSTGEINIGAVTGGTSPYTYSVGGSAYTSVTSYTGLSANVYTVLVKDAGGCILAQSDTVSNTNAPVITLDSISSISCSGGIPGSISISVSGGVPGYTYSWSNGTITEDQSSLFAITSYTVTVTDMNGCSSSAFYPLNSLSAVYGAVTVTNGNCGSLGTATVVASGGTSSFTYSWNTVPVQTTATATNLASGTYSCLITDGGGCTRTVYASVYNSCYNFIKGNVYEDANSNCVRDAGEVPLSGRTVIATGTSGTYYGSTDLNGDYMIQTLNTNNSVFLSSYSTPYFTPVCPVSGSLSVNFSTAGDTLDANNFGFYSNPYVDLFLHPGWTSANPGFPKEYWIYYGNYSPTAQNAVITFVYDSVLQYVSSTLGGVHYPAQHKIEWTFTGIPAYAGWIWTRPQAFFNVPVTVNVSDILHSYFEITPIIGDAHPLDNTLNNYETVLGCHDPNSKAVNPTGTGPGGDIFAPDSILTYTVHFQNNGNDTAHFVIVKDTLSDHLDPASVTPGAASHPYTFSLNGEGELTFRFDNIMLPDSTSDEPGSNGYFTYTVHVKPGTPTGAVINNTASIYFDFNEAVVTNTTVNTLVDVAMGIPAQAAGGAVNVYPNPFTDNTTFVIRSGKLSETYSFEMTDVLGKVVRRIKTNEKQFTLSRNSLQDGMYFYSITDAEGVVGMGKVIIE